MAESRRRRHSSKASFGDSAPPNTIPFPEQANMTVAEILAFLPNCINCPDVVYRLISNGGTRKAIHAIINTYREFEVEWSANCCGEAMYKTMDKGGYPDWTIKKHSLWHDSRKDSWDENGLSVGSLRTLPNGPAGTVSFRRLAENVRTMPDGDDALDLTRIIQYCLVNDKEEWRYPRDYDELLDLLGGPAEVKQGHTDRSVFERWENRRPPPPVERPPHGIKLFDGWKVSKRERGSSKDGRPRTVSPGGSLLAERRAARKKARSHAETARLVEVEPVSQSDDDGGMPYARAPPEYVPLPSGGAPPPTVPSIVSVFKAEGFAGESDPYSAYAFGGPRRAPPYRLLHQIAQPHPRDGSGWAENLRWAFEQRILFAKEHPTVGGWTESPVHMGRIERERIQRVWASEELLDQLLESE